MKFEYKSLLYSSNDFPFQAEANFSGLGKQGWELVLIEPPLGEGRNKTAWFKRPIPENDRPGTGPK